MTNQFIVSELQGTFASDELLETLSSLDTELFIAL